MDKIALFDFCGTLVKFQTFDPFCEYVIEKLRPQKKWLVQNKYILFLAKIVTKIRPDIHLYKRLLIRQLKGLTVEELDTSGREYYQRKIKSNLVSAAVDRLLLLKECGFRNIIVSAGCVTYIRYFADEYGIKDVIAENLQFSNGRCTGKLDDKECCGNRKVVLWHSYQLQNNIEGEIEYGFSDSKSDQPMLSLCRKQVVISCNGHQKWVTDEMEEILCEKS